MLSDCHNDQSFARICSCASSQSEVIKQSMSNCIHRRDFSGYGEITCPRSPSLRPSLNQKNAITASCQMISWLQPFLYRARYGRVRSVPERKHTYILQQKQGCPKAMFAYCINSPVESNVHMKQPTASSKTQEAIFSWVGERSHLADALLSKAVVYTDRGTRGRRATAVSAFFIHSDIYLYKFKLSKTSTGHAANDYTSTDLLLSMTMRSHRGHISVIADAVH
eukprot:5187353-Pleurochrysis_carterae.AAC.1